MRLVSVMFLALSPIALASNDGAPASAAPQGTPPTAPRAPAGAAAPGEGGLGFAGQAYGGAGEPLGTAPGQWAGQGAGQATGYGAQAYSAQGYGGCNGCSYSGDYYGPTVRARRPAPALRLQGEWRNGWWYY